MHGCLPYYCSSLLTWMAWTIPISTAALKIAMDIVLAVDIRSSWSTVEKFCNRVRKTITLTLSSVMFSCVLGLGHDFNCCQSVDSIAKMDVCNNIFHYVGNRRNTFLFWKPISVSTDNRLALKKTQLHTYMFIIPSCLIQVHV